MAEYDFFPGDPYGKSAVTRLGNCRCGQVFYTNSNGQVKLPHKPGEYEGCKWAGITRETRMCCDSTEAQWHSRPCVVNGPTEPEDVHEGLKRYWEGDPEMERAEPRIEVTGHGVVAYDAEGKAVAGFDEDPAKDPRGRTMYVEYTEGETAAARLEAGPGFASQYRTCCVVPHGQLGHHPFCRQGGSFTLGQIVDKGYQTDPFGPRPMLRMREDPVSNDRTFENETRLH